MVAEIWEFRYQARRTGGEGGRKVSKNDCFISLCVSQSHSAGQGILTGSQDSIKNNTLTLFISLKRKFKPQRARAEVYGVWCLDKDLLALVALFGVFFFFFSLFWFDWNVKFMERNRGERQLRLNIGCRPRS